MTSFPARIVPTSTVLSAVAILASYSQAQTCDLEHDFVTTSGPSSSVPTAGARIDGVDDPAAAFAELGGHRYFRATTLGAGAELWRTDGTAAGTTLVADLEPGPAGSEPSELTVVGGELFFVATTAAHGSELWKSDGTAAGTVLVHDLVAGPGGSDPGNLIALGGKLCFGATTAAAGREPWVTDGTAAGSGLLAQTGFGNLDGGFLRPTLGAGGGYVLFHVLAGPGASPALWRTDGTPAGTFALASMAPGAGTSDLSSGFHLGGDTLLALPTIAHGTELWRTDGTVAGTSLAHEFAAGAADGMEPLGPRAAAVHGGLLHLAARDGAGELRLFATDGTSAGTSQVIGSGHAPADLVAAAGDLFYTASLPATGRELWRLAGGSAAMVAEAFGGPIDGIPTGVGQLTPLGSGVAYVAFDPIGGMEYLARDTRAGQTSP